MNEQSIVHTVQIILAVVGSAGFGMAAKTIIEVVQKLRQGVSAKEGKRKTDLVQQRDEAHSAVVALEKRAEVTEAALSTAVGRLEIANTYIADLREYCISHGTPIANLPKRPPIT